MLENFSANKSDALQTEESVSSHSLFISELMVAQKPQPESRADLVRADEHSPILKVAQYRPVGPVGRIDEIKL